MPYYRHISDATLCCQVTLGQNKMKKRKKRNKKKETASMKE